MSVTRVWSAFRAFLTAEEVPRWFGLSLVLIYLCGLGSAAFSAVNAVRAEADRQLGRADRYAVAALAERLAGVTAGGTVPDTARAQTELYDFAAHVPTRYARLIDGDRRVLAASNPGEVGAPAVSDRAAGERPAEMEATLVTSDGPAPDRLLRVPVGDRARGWYLEVRLPPALQESASLAGQANTSFVVLVVLGALFVVYRALRAQLRGVSQIADRLHSHRDHIPENLSALRLADAEDGISTAWNQLVDLTTDLSTAMKRAAANDELTRALARSGGGALAEALNSIPDGLIYITDEVRFEYLNAPACRLLGCSASDAKRMTLPEARCGGIGARVLEVVRSALHADGSFESRTEVVSAEQDASGDSSSYRVWVIPLQRAHHSGECVVIVRDVSQQVRAERAREDFVTQVTHELRTPLTNIRAYAETLSSGMFDDPKVITECYNVITKETRRLSRLIEDILSVSQLEVGSIELRVDTVDLKTLLSEGVRDVRGLADEKNIDIQLLLPAKMEPIRADRDKLAVVINNLLGNAIKYTPKDGNVVLACQYSGDEVVITCKDNGIGIDPADHARVFEKFQRANDPAVLAESGTGIGLYTAREIVRRHGGDIELISEKGSGSTFMVRLPHRESRAAALSAPEA